uniref:Lipocalin n=1 Tax=Rhipicephalus zambeziensis TaxID=60191 RepID=A0A224YDG8_9ACAR
MKYVKFCLWQTCLFTLFCLGEQLDGFDFIFMRKAARKIVRRLLQDKDVLLISRAIYGRPDYPMCVQSRPLGLYAQKIRANFSYFEKDLNALRTNGHRIYRDTYIDLFKMKKKKIMNVSAYIENQKLDTKLSGQFRILYSRKICFIVGTEKNANSSKGIKGAAGTRTENSACVLWRKAHGTEKERSRCRKAFKRKCGHYRGHRHVYSREECLAQIKA